MIGEDASGVAHDGARPAAEGGEHGGEVRLKTLRSRTLHEELRRTAHG